MEDIGEDDQLYRRRAKSQITDVRVNSGAYSRKTPWEISVDLARLTTQELALESKPEFGLGALTVADVRRLGLEVRHDPTDGNPAHCLIIGSYSHKAAKDMARLTRIIKSPD